MRRNSEPLRFRFLTGVVALNKRNDRCGVGKSSAIAFEEDIRLETLSYPEVGSAVCSRAANRIVGDIEIEPPSIVPPRLCSTPLAGSANMVLSVGRSAWPAWRGHHGNDGVTLPVNPVAAEAVDDDTTLLRPSR